MRGVFADHPNQLNAAGYPKPRFGQNQADRHPVKLGHCRLRAIGCCNAIAEFAEPPGKHSAIAAVGFHDEDSRPLPLAGNMIEIEAHSHADGAKWKWLTAL